MADPGWEKADSDAAPDCQTQATEGCRELRELGKCRLGRRNLGGSRLTRRELGGSRLRQKEFGGRPETEGVRWLKMPGLRKLGGST